jgi:hypothetical protein
VQATENALNSTWSAPSFPSAMRNAEGDAAEKLKAYKAVTEYQVEFETQQFLEPLRIA